MCIIFRCLMVTYVHDFQPFMVIFRCLMVKEAGRYNEKSKTFPEAMLACGKRQAQLVPFSSCAEIDTLREVLTINNLIT